MFNPIIMLNQSENNILQTSAMIKQSKCIKVHSEDWSNEGMQDFAKFGVKSSKAL